MNKKSQEGLTEKKEGGTLLVFLCEKNLGYVEEVVANDVER